MATIKLPISKSIANRLLLLQAIHGDSLLRVSSDMPDDVIVLHDALQQIRDRGYAKAYEADSRPKYLVGASFSSKTGTIEEWDQELEN